MSILEHVRQSRGYQLLAMAAFFTLTLFVLIASAGASNDDQAKGGRLVTFHDRGQEKVILTHARTVRDALGDAGIRVAPKDQVEPGIDEELIAADCTVNVYRARPVIVVDGSVRQKIMTAAQTARSMAADAGLQLQDEDTTKIARTDDVLADGASTMLTIDRATPFTLNLYGTQAPAYSQAATVGDMLRAKNIALGPDDSVSVDESSPLVRGMTVAVWRNGIQTATVEEKIPFAVRQIQDADQAAGYKKVQTPGTDGRKNVTYEIVMRNGKEVSRKTIQSVTLEQPKEQVEVVGAKPSFSGDFAAALAKLRACESGGNYANKKNPKYRGAYQFGYGTWANKYGIYDPADATPAQQDQAARELYVRRGWQPWPHCGANLPDSYR